ncbi:hypothetical protein CGZ93_04885 [Enemella dayhoffiae]|uniref:Uncharacterized protein n=1 Tax=Enemella dayhoffiae TaxID=2016507 RepID=A0A255HA11_9ACTN|nr:DUF5691 domain-containing protein [Enemella dayhoffiae]OYO24156.1 hypothetical protein CGZ93_04885 [Enemella dayhoffiae]
MNGLPGLVAAAVVGTGRRTVDWTSVPPALRAGDAADGDPAVEVLRVAGRAAVAQRVTGGLVEATNIPAAPPAETRAAPPSRFVRLLDESIGSRRVEVVAEGLTLLADNALRLPIGALVGVLELARSRRELRPLLPPVLGERGSWMAQQNPAWRFLEVTRADPNDDQVWSEGTLAERVTWLTGLRCTNPGRVRELLASDFAAEPAEARAALLRVLSSDTRPADEQLLEKALEDRSQTVRTLARELLPRIVESAYVQRIRKSVRRRLRPGEDGWRVDLNDFDAAEQRDGLTVNGRDGEKSAMAILIGALPITDWPELLDTPATDLVTAEVTGGPGFEAGLTIAALREGDPALALALLGATDRPDPDLFGLVGQAEADQLMAGWLNEDSQLWLDCLAVRGWSPELSERIARWLERDTSANARLHVVQLCATHTHLTRAAEMAGHLRGLARSGWTGALQNRALTTALTLELRRGLFEALEQSTNERERR